MAEDYLDLIAAELEAQRVVLNSGEPPTETALEQKILGSIEGFLPYRNEFLEFVICISKYGADTRLYEAIRKFFTRISPLMLENYNNGGLGFQDIHTFLIPELFLYTISILIKHDRFQEAGILLGASYPSHFDPARSRPDNYTVFVPYMQHVNQWQGNRIRLGSTATLRLLKERAVQKEITYLDILDTDYALFIRSMLNPSAVTWRKGWTPVTFMDALNCGFMNGFPLFLRARAHNDFCKLCLIMNVTSKEDFIKRFNAAFAQDLEKEIRSYEAEGKDINKRLTNIDALDTIQ